MRSRFLLVIAVFFLVSASAYAQDFAGTWAGEAQGRGGTQEVTLELEVSGDDVSGTFMQGQQSGRLPMLRSTAARSRFQDRSRRHRANSTSVTRAQSKTMS